MVRHLATGVLALVLLVAQAAPAEAHTGDKSGPTNYETVIAGVTPAVAGLRVRSIDLSSQMELRNETGRTVVVLGYEDEPYLKVTPDDGIYLNMESPAAYLNATRTGKNSVPADVDPKAKPR